MSDHVALALLVFTLLQAVVVTRTLAEGGPASLPFVALALLVIAVIPACRMFERRWAGLDDDAARDPARGPAFRREAGLLWTLALALPAALHVAVRLIAL
jgi:hypothetical protein